MGSEGDAVGEPAGHHSSSRRHGYSNAPVAPLTRPTRRQWGVRPHTAPGSSARGRPASAAATAAATALAKTSQQQQQHGAKPFRKGGTAASAAEARLQQELRQLAWQVGWHLRCLEPPPPAPPPHGGGPVRPQSSRETTRQRAAEGDRGSNDSESDDEQLLVTEADAGLTYRQARAKAAARLALAGDAGERSAAAAHLDGGDDNDDNSSVLSLGPGEEHSSSSGGGGDGDGKDALERSAGGSSGAADALSPGAEPNQHGEGEEEELARRERRLGREAGRRVEEARLEARAMRCQRELYQGAAARLLAAPGFRVVGGASFADGGGAVGGGGCGGVSGGDAEQFEQQRQHQQAAEEEQAPTQPVVACAVQQSSAHDSGDESDDGGNSGASSARSEQGSKAAAGPGRLFAVAPGTDALELGHTGLRPQQLPAVATALAAAPWLRALRLQGNLLDDAAVGELVALLGGPAVGGGGVAAALATPAAAAASDAAAVATADSLAPPAPAALTGAPAAPAAPRLEELDLSANAALTWRCCEPLARLCAAPPRAPAPTGRVAPGVLGGPRAAVSTSGAAAGRLRLRRLCLAGVQVGDRGARLLADALGRGGSPLRALLLARAGVRDAGCAALCAALPAAAALEELDLSWNAAGAATARALEAALVPAAAADGDGDDDADGNGSDVESDGDGSAGRLALRVLRLANVGLGDRDGAIVLDALAATRAARWRLVDLSDNALEGGAALCAAAAVEAASAAAEAAAAGAGEGEVEPAGCARALLLDGNPLGASGALCVMRSLAGRHAIAEARPARRLAAPPPMLHVSIGGCSLASGEKGLRLGTSDRARGVAVVSRATTLFAAVEGAIDAPAAAPAAASATASASAAPAAVALVVTERCAGLDLNCPAGGYALELAHPAAAHVVARLLELKARLPAFARQLEEEAAAASGAVAADAAAKPAPAAAAEAPDKGGSAQAAAASAVVVPARRRSTRDFVREVVRRASRVEAPEAPPPPQPEPPPQQQQQRLPPPPVESLALADIQLDGGRAIRLERLLELKPWAAARAARRRAQRSAGSQPTGAQQQQEAPAPAAAAAAARRARAFRRLAFSVRAAAVLSAAEPPLLPGHLLAWALGEMRRPRADDGWRLRLVELLLRDWLLEPEQVCKTWGRAKRGAAKTAAPVCVAQSYTLINNLTVALPPFPPLSALPQARELLACFDPGLGQAQRLAAAELAHARLAQPLDFWQSVAAAALTAPQRAELRARAPACLGAVDRGNLTGRYALDLARPPDRAFATRLQLAALQEGAWRGNRHFTSWRGAALDGRALRGDALPRLQAFAVPQSGALRLDFVSYRVPPPGAAPAADGDVRALLLRRLRAARGEYSRRVLALRSRQQAQQAASASVKVADGRPWWAASGLDASALLLSASADKPSGAAAAAAAAGAAAGATTDAQSERDRTRILLGRLLRAGTGAELAAAFAALSDAAARAVVIELCAVEPGGLAAAASLLERLPPVVASRLAVEGFDAPQALLPPPLRARLLAAVAAEPRRAIAAAAAEVSAAAAARSAASLAAVREFAAGRHVSCAQLAAALRALAPDAREDRVGAAAALWSRVADRGGLVGAFQALAGAEQLGVMARLGFAHVWASLRRPEGLRFRLDLRAPEQREVARAVVKDAVAKSLAERARTGQRVRHLRALVAAETGRPILDPEDEKLWLSLESKHAVIEFDYARTWEQELQLMAGAVRRIQRAWRARRAAPRLRQLQQQQQQGGDGGSGGGGDGAEAECSCCSCSCDCDDCADAQQASAAEENEEQQQEDDDDA